MKKLTGKYAGLVVLTAFLAMPITHAVANEKVDAVQEVITDSWITSKVKAVFLANPNISALDITVETVDGVVSLSGEVTTEAERDLAVSTAEEIKGVQAVAAEALYVSE